MNAGPSRSAPFTSATAIHDQGTTRSVEFLDVGKGPTPDTVGYIATTDIQKRSRIDTSVHCTHEVCGTAKHIFLLNKEVLLDLKNKTALRGLIPARAW